MLYCINVHSNAQQTGLLNPWLQILTQLWFFFLWGWFGFGLFFVDRGFFFCFVFQEKHKSKLNSPSRSPSTEVNWEPCNPASIIYLLLSCIISLKGLFLTFNSLSNTQDVAFNPPHFWMYSNILYSYSSKSLSEDQRWLFSNFFVNILRHEAHAMKRTFNISNRFQDIFSTYSFSM